MKIGASSGTPSESLVAAQRALCVDALEEELRGIHRGVVVILTNATHGISDEAIGRVAPNASWDKSHTEDGIYFLDLTQTVRTIHGYHPGYTQQAKFFDEALERTIELAGDFAVPR